MRRPLRPRGSLPYDKPPMTIESLVTRLGDRGMEIPSRDRATRYLRHIGYYRLSPYTIPFQQGRPDHQFHPGTSFDDVLDLYVFDRKLRLLVLDALERVEVAVRAALTDHMSTTYGDSHWYTNPTHFTKLRSHSNLLGIVQTTSEKRLSGAPETGDGRFVHPSALKHYLTTYGTPAMPPSWVMVENLTIGQLSSMFRNLRRRSDRNNIAKSIGLTSPVLESWMSTYTRVRNISAHHGRLWNVGLGVYPVIPTSSSISWIHDEDPLPGRSRKRLYPVLVSLQSVLDTIAPHSGWAQRLSDLLLPRPEMNLTGMGMPENCRINPFWTRHINQQ